MKKKDIFIIFAFLFMTSVSYALPGYSVLCSFLEDISGWDGESCEGMNMQGAPMGEMVTASKKYTAGQKSIEVVIVGGTSSFGMWAPFQSHIEINTPDNFLKVVNEKGFDIGISYDKKDKSGSIVIPLKKGPNNIVAVLCFNFSHMNWKEALQFAKKFNWKKLNNKF